jgi:hypothetical protein
MLCAEGLLEPMPKRQRVHQACDPAPFLASVEELKKEAGITSGKKPAAKAKAKAKVASKAPTKRTAKTAKTPRQSPAASRKGK